MSAAPPITCQSYGLTLVIQLQTDNLRDQNEVLRLRDELLSSAAQSQDVILDFSRVRLVGSVAFLAFLALRRHAGVERVIVCELSEHVLSTFQLCNLLENGSSDEKPFVHARSLRDALVLCNISDL